MASSEDLSGSLDVDVVGLVDLDFKSEPDFFDFDSGGEYGLFGEAGVALHTTATTTTGSSTQPLPSAPHSGGGGHVSTSSQHHHHNNNSTSSHIHSTSSHHNNTTSSHHHNNASSHHHHNNNASSPPPHHSNTSSHHHHNTTSHNNRKGSGGHKGRSHWSEFEKDLFLKGMDLFGVNWNRISSFISTKTPSQVKSFYKKWAETANVIQDVDTDAFAEPLIYMSPEPVCISTDLDDPLGLIETATTTVITTPLSPKRVKADNRHSGGGGGSRELDVRLGSGGGSGSSIRGFDGRHSSHNNRHTDRDSSRGQQEARQHHNINGELEDTHNNTREEEEEEDMGEAEVNSLVVVDGRGGLEVRSGVDTDEMFVVPSIGEEWVVETCDLVTATAPDPKPPRPKKKKSSSTSSSSHKSKKKKASRPSNTNTLMLPNTSIKPFKTKSPPKQKVKKKKKKLKVATKGNNSDKKKYHQQQPNLNVHTLPAYDTMPQLGVPDLGQVVHLVKADGVEESDVDIDISDDEQLVIVDKPQGDDASKSHGKNSSEERIYHNASGITKESHNDGYSVIGSEVMIDGGDGSSRKQHVFNFPPPVEERELDEGEATDEERRVHFEYFDGKGVKTPERYLKIRNYLVNYWKHVRPSYVRKTTVRSGLKNCGDVNSIGKVHEYLEKIGAINFGCQESNYTSPLVVGVKPKEKVCVPTKTVVKVDRSEMARQKQKKKWDMSLCEGGGLTISHDESGAVVDACHIPEAPRVRTGAGGSQTGARMEQFKLVRCLEHDPDTTPPFSVVLHAHALITLDLHAHTSLAEVMGLLGGYYDPVAKMLHVTVAVPTKAASSGVECDMCPVSQSSACTAIHEGGVQVVGWYHSHPTFPPNPSMQDLDTQNQMQRWFARQDAPFLGIIISPFCPTNRSEASQIRCIVLDRAPHQNTSSTPTRTPLHQGSTGPTQGSSSESSPHTPYKLVWSVSEVVPGAWEEVCQGVRKVVSSARDDPMAIEWRGEWRGQATNWEKAIASLNHHLPQHFGEQLQAVRTAFLSAVRECIDT
ncbi:hypothetical protein Pcinc_035738 [Petrolisthes cinctipes]|uniref:Myb-like, SWIRM and MPN domain-containing protein 1 n=1 Tax=Petrolisthes cinctipes TaxID=88211 RepID=A0AAE1C092_PETCI|nr:hypothetical protein Pcinc_035738 [Petrolisthes cinctipes]